MHLPDTILLPHATGVALTAAAGAVSLAGLIWGGRGMSAAETARTAMITAFVFVASAVPIPVPPVSTHLGFYGLAGVLLGRRVLLVAPIAFGLQAVLFGHGGLAAIGLNSTNMVAGALVAAAWFRATSGRGNARLGIAAFGAGALGILVISALVIGELLLVGEPLVITAAAPVFLATAALEGVVTVLVLGAFARFFSELLVLPKGDAA